MEVIKHDTLPEFQFATGGQTVADTLPKWSGKTQPPKVGQKVRVRVNNCGPGLVTRYAVVDGWLGVYVKLFNPPKWYVEQNKGNVEGILFGAEIDILEEGEEHAQ